MPFRKTANAIVSKTAIEFDEWMDELRQQHEGAVAKDHVGRIAKDVLRKCDPKQFLLSHATIVASVDTYQPRGAKTGQRMERGVQIDVRYPDFRVKPECQDIINNNGDAWERSLLLATYRTFIGAPNYLEHIQIPELAKGFIVDAIARDLGSTCYVDILVATDRKHQVLVRDIMAGNIKAMSMGCISLFTVCNKCGNVASDDTQLCPCILYEGKGSKFADDEGVEHRLGELIGHVSVPGSNTFIEASWVRNPAFAGAERRNFLNAEMASTAAFSDALGRGEAISLVRASQPLPSGVAKAASVRTAEDGDQGAQDAQSGEPAPSEQSEDGDEAAGSQDDGGTPSASPAAPAEDRLEDLVNKAQEMLLEGIVKGLGEKLAPKPDDVPTATPSLSDANLNETLLTGGTIGERITAERLRSVFPGHDSLIGFYLRTEPIVAAGRAAVARSSLTSSDLVVFSWIRDTVRGVAMPARLYQAAMKAGHPNNFPSERSYLAAVGVKSGLALDVPGSKMLSRLRNIASVARNV